MLQLLNVAAKILVSALSASIAEVLKEFQTSNNLNIPKYVTGNFSVINLPSQSVFLLLREGDRFSLVHKETSTSAEGLEIH